MKKIHLNLFLPFLLSLFLFAVFITLEKEIIKGNYDPTNIPSALIGKSIPEFLLTNLDDENILFTNNDMPKGPYILNVWATWCISCRIEHDYLLKLRNKNITIIGLNYKDDRTKSLAWLQRIGNPYFFNLYDNKGDLGLDIGVYGAPESFFIDSNGIVKYRHIGILDDEIWREKIIPLGLKW